MRAMNSATAAGLKNPELVHSSTPFRKRAVVEDDAAARLPSGGLRRSPDQTHGNSRPASIRNNCIAVTGRCRGGHFAKLRADLRADFADRETSIPDSGRSLINQPSCSSIGGVTPVSRFTSLTASSKSHARFSWRHRSQMPMTRWPACHDRRGEPTNDGVWAPHVQGQPGETWSSSRLVTYEAERASSSETPAGAFGSKTRHAKRLTLASAAIYGLP